jgi:hypothetical protein
MLETCRKRDTKNSSTSPKLTTWSQRKKSESHERRSLQTGEQHQHCQRPSAHIGAYQIFTCHKTMERGRNNASSKKRYVLSSAEVEQCFREAPKNLTSHNRPPSPGREPNEGENSKKSMVMTWLWQPSIYSPAKRPWAIETTKGSDGAKALPPPSFT